jgi:hypothetical protein
MNWLTRVIGTAKGALLHAWSSIDTPKAIVIAAAIFGLCYVAGNLYKVVRISNDDYVLLNSLTGSIDNCKVSYRYN